MKISHLLLLMTLGGLMSFEANTQFQARGNQEQQAIGSLTENWLAAMNAKDIPRLLTMITDDAVFLPIGRPPIRGKKEIEDMYRMFFSQFSSIEQTATVDEVEVAGEWAFTWGSETMTLVPNSGGPAMELQGKGMSILRRQPDGSWKFARGINNDIPAQLAPRTK